MHIADDEVNQARKFLFGKGNMKIKNIAPTQAAVVQHIKRAIYQAKAGHIWGQSLILPLASDWGWTRHSPNDSWHPFL